MTQVQVDGVTLTLDVKACKWSADGTGIHGRSLAALANHASLGYRYRPSDGEPGSLLASRVAERLGGKAILPPPSPLPEVVPPGVDPPAPSA